MMNLENFLNKKRATSLVGFVFSFLSVFLFYCALSVSTARATVLLDWDKGTLGGNSTPGGGTGYAGSPATITYQYSADYSGTGEDITVNLVVASGYSASGVTAYFSLGGGDFPSGTITVNGTTYTTSGSNLGTLSFGNIANGGTDTATFDITSITGTPGKLMNFNDIDFSGTVSPVPEPAAWGAISGIGLLGLCGIRTLRERRVQNKFAVIL